MEAIKTAYNTAFSRLVLLAKSGKIGDIVSVDATCTSLKELAANEVENLPYGIVRLTGDLQLCCRSLKF